MSTHQTPIVVIGDLEWTCGVPEPESETVEIAMVAFREREELGSFQSMVKPVLHPALTELFTQVTGIEQHHVASADLFPVVWERLTKWLSQYGNTFWSWGPSDGRQLQKDCSRNGLNMLLRNENLARAVRKRYGCNKRGAMRKLGLTAIGKDHRAMVDARNVAQIALAMEIWKPRQV